MWKGDDKAESMVFRVEGLGQMAEAFDCGKR